MRPPYFLYSVLPETWADWCCKRPENLTILFSLLSVILSCAALLLTVNN